MYFVSNEIIYSDIVIKQNYLGEFYGIPGVPKPRALCKNSSHRIIFYLIIKIYKLNYM